MVIEPTANVNMAVVAQKNPWFLLRRSCFLACI